MYIHSSYRVNVQVIWAVLWLGQSLSGGEHTQHLLSWNLFIGHLSQRHHLPQDHSKRPLCVYVWVVNVRMCIMCVCGGGGREGVRESSIRSPPPLSTHVLFSLPYILTHMLIPTHIHTHHVRIVGVSLLTDGLCCLPLDGAHFSIR